MEAPIRLNSIYRSIISEANYVFISALQQLSTQLLLEEIVEEPRVKAITPPAVEPPSMATMSIKKVHLGGGGGHGITSAPPAVEPDKLARGRAVARGA